MNTLNYTHQPPGPPRVVGATIAYGCGVLLALTAVSAVEALVAAEAPGTAEIDIAAMASLFYGIATLAVFWLTCSILVHDAGRSAPRRLAAFVGGLMQPVIPYAIIAAASTRFAKAADYAAFVVAWGWPVLAAFVCAKRPRTPSD